MRQKMAKNKQHVLEKRHIITNNNKLSLVERLKLCQKPFSAYIIIIAKCFRNHILNTQAVLVS